MARSRADVMGFVSTRPEPRSDCRDSHGYTRKPRFSVCWLHLGRPLNAPTHAAVWRLPGAHAADVFSGPPP